MNLRKLLFLCLLLPVGNKIVADNKPVEETIIALERAAMDRWAKGDPDGFIELCTWILSWNKSWKVLTN